MSQIRRVYCIAGFWGAVLCFSWNMACAVEPEQVSDELSGLHLDNFYWDEIITEHLVADVLPNWPREDAVTIVTGEGNVFWADTKTMVFKPLSGVVRAGLGALSNDESVLLQVESRYDELVNEDDSGEELILDEVEDLDAEDLNELIDDELEGETSAAISELEAEFDTHTWFLNRGDASPERVSRPKIWAFNKDELFLSVSEGLFRYEVRRDLWQLVIPEVVTSMVIQPRTSVIFAASLSGLWRSESGRTFTQLKGAPVDLGQIQALFIDQQGTIWVGSGSGLWKVLDGFIPVESISGSVFNIIPDQNGSISWVLSSDGVYRSMSEGTSWMVWPSLPAGDFYDVGALALGQWLFCGSTGVWGTQDDGITWGSTAEGVGEAQCSNLRPQGDSLWLMTDQGMFRAAARLPGQEKKSPQKVTTPPVSSVSLRQLLDAVLHRTGLTPSPVRHSRALAWILPSVSMEASYRTGGALKFNANGTLFDSAWLDDGTDDYQGAGTSRDSDGSFALLFRLEWQPPGRTGSSEPWTISQGTETIVATELSGEQMAIRVDRGQRAYQTKLVDEVNTLYFTHRKLVQDQAGVKEHVSLLERSLLELRVQEVRAQLDALTDGSMSRLEELIQQTGTSGG